ncbi:hypothetical protein Ccrd_010167 [Cynara cardunculus var. scolymus]|uniref:Uncharacterized protein n=1 Tax=Cynara cardunculus var. scolymus TaxID=59895 RepID=A0A118K702_CYNCS|nr:hypothetical protein Ccrd_010167 [Cynara cardunculus var. scolymus]
MVLSLSPSIFLCVLHLDFSLLDFVYLSLYLKRFSHIRISFYTDPVLCGFGLDHGTTNSLEISTLRLLFSSFLLSSRRTRKGRMMLNNHLRDTKHFDFFNALDKTRHTSDKKDLQYTRYGKTNFIKFYHERCTLTFVKGGP